MRRFAAAGAAIRFLKPADPPPPIAAPRPGIRFKRDADIAKWAAVIRAAGIKAE